jgi:transposase-like protein
MGQGRRHFTDEFKQEAIALLVSSGRPLSQIASELGISPSMLRNWDRWFESGSLQRGVLCEPDFLGIRFGQDPGLLRARRRMRLLWKQR